MALYEIAPPRVGAPLPRPVDLTCFALICLHVTWLVTGYVSGSWIIGPDGNGIPADFVNVWAAGKLVLEHNPAAAYDWATHKDVEAAALGYRFVGYFGWHYPPPALAVAALLSLMPYAVSYLVWVFATFPLYLVAIRAIVGERVGYVLAAAFPAILCNFAVGQNGFLSAALLGGALVTLIEKPLIAGLFFGILTYKPHLGFLIPVALLAGGHWRTIGAATAVAVAMALASWVAYGTPTWLAFIDNIGHTSDAFLSAGQAKFEKLQTVFGLVRTLGLGEPAAWATQGVVTLMAALGVAALWRSRATFEIKAAGLGAAALLATPYLYTYDLVVLAVPAAYLFRMGRATGFRPYELSGMGVACLLILSFPFVEAPVGLAAILIVLALVIRRALPHARPAPATA